MQCVPDKTDGSPLSTTCFTYSLLSLEPLPRALSLTCFLLCTFVLFDFCKRQESAMASQEQDDHNPLARAASFGWRGEGDSVGWADLNSHGKNLDALVRVSLT